MADLISEIVSQEALEQVAKLTALLEKATGQMELAIVSGAELNKTLTGNSAKEANTAINNLNNTTAKLIEVESERLVVETKLKENEAKMAESVKVSTKAIDDAKRIWKAFALGNEELADRIAEATLKLEAQKQLLKDAKGASNYKQILASTTIETAKLKAEISEYTKEMKRNIQQMDISEDSVKYMSVLLAQATDQWSKLSEEERNSDFGVQFTASINELDAKLKGLEGSVGNYKRMVGGYLITSESMRGQLKEIIQALAEEKLKMDGASDAIKKQEAEVKRLANSVGTNSSEYQEAKMKLDSMKLGLQQATKAMSELEREGGKIQDAMGDARTAIQGMANDAGNTAAVSQGVGVLADSFSVFQAGMAAVGLEGEDMMRVYAKMMIVQQGFNSLTQITNALQSESVLRLKLKAIWDKVSLVFTEKKTAATVKETAAETVNAAATTAGATATAGLATAEGVATATSWTLVGSLKAVGAAIKSIPVIGWILAAVAALGTLTVLLYKHLSAEKELTAEQESRKALAESMRNVQKNVTEETTETVIRLQMYLKGLDKAKQGSKEWNSIVKDIAELTGKTRQEIGNSTKDIKANTDAWIEQYVARATAEAKLQEIIDNNIKMAEIERDIKSRSVYEDEDALDAVIKKMNITKEDEKFLRKNLETLYETTEGTEKNAEAWGNINDIIGSVSLGIKTLNNQLTKQIKLTDLISNDNEKNKETMKSYQNEILKLRAELYLTGEELLMENTRIELAISEKKYQDEVKQLRDKNQSTEDLEKLHQLEIVKIQQDGFAKIQALRQKNFEDSVNWNVKQQEENDKTNQQFIDQARDAQNIVLAQSDKYFDEQVAIMQKQIEINEKRVQSIYELVDSFASLGSAIAGNIEDEKKRILVEQRVAEVQLAVTKALAIAEVLLDKGGDPWLKAIRIAANLAVVTAGFIQAENAIKQAGSISAYAEGTDYHRGGGAIIGEGGQPELLQVNGRSSWITEPTYFPSLPVGASVTPLDDMQQDNREVELLQKLYDKEWSMVKIDVSGKILPTLIKDGRVIRFSNKLIEARG